ncbi:helix-turn-helix transcriptional regulator [Couchioplanes caeruleus]|uniref:Helix-turn-helix protein n=1 Tax=Couchioplanes caeruleus TaxID=56438 RepID=A0A3N1GGS9_9ACTN|nr:helix-turn-helix domain-containing protein [Couchioplanes caeruleus]ROP29351.1 helix-turn-helix protein [Couchioplanes caeruleus]
MATASASAAAVDRLWTIDDVSAFLRVPIATLYQWRHHRVGPPAFKVGRHLRYDPTAVRAWLVSQEA